MWLFRRGKPMMHKQNSSQPVSSEVIPLCCKWGGSPTSLLQEGFSSSYLHGSADTLSALSNSKISVQDRDIFWSNLFSLTWRPELLKEGTCSAKFSKCNKYQSNTVKTAILTWNFFLKLFFFPLNHQQIFWGRDIGRLCIQLWSLQSLVSSNTFL